MYMKSKRKNNNNNNKGIDEPICGEGMETQLWRMDLWTHRGGRE